MSKEQNEVLEQQWYLLERRMYRLDPAPPKLPAQEYIVRYLTEEEDKYLAWYLHDQEPALNKLAQAACERYAMAEHFADIKQAAVCGILAALQKYDPAVGAPFAAFQKRYMQDGVGDYIRTAQSGVITMTADTYPVMRRIMAIYHLNGDGCSDSCIQRIADETGMGEKSVRKYIAIGTLNERRVDFYRQYDEDGEETGEDVALDDTWNYSDILWNGIQAEKVQRAFDKLNYREQTLLEKRLAICMTCGHVGSWKGRPTFEELAVMFEGSTASGAERAYRRAVDKLTELLVAEGAIHAVRLKQKSKTKRKKKIATAIYEYQADCDGEWGQISFDFENGTSEIVRLADWDTMKTNRFANKAIAYLLNCENEKLPKETIVAFEL